MQRLSPDRVCFFVLCKRHWINRVPAPSWTLFLVNSPSESPSHGLSPPRKIYHGVLGVYCKAPGSSPYRANQRRGVRPNGGLRVYDSTVELSSFRVLGFVGALGNVFQLASE